MSCGDQNEIVGGAELTLAAMDEHERWAIGRQTYLFVMRVLRDPELRKLHAQKKAELQASGYFDRLNGLENNNQVVSL